MARGTPLLLPPTLDEIIKAAKDIGLPEREARKFFNFYSCKGWMVGKSRMVSFKGALENWKFTWEERGCPAPGSNGNGSVPAQPPAAIDKVILQKEFERVLERMRTLRSSYGEMQTWSRGDGLEFKKLLVRRNELKKLLGVTI